MKYEIGITLGSGTLLRDTIEAPEDVDPREAQTGAWKKPIQVEVERLTREGYHRAANGYRGLRPIYYPPHTIWSITYKEVY